MGAQMVIIGSRYVDNRVTVIVRIVARSQGWQRPFEFKWKVKEGQSLGNRASIYADTSPNPDCPANIPPQTTFPNFTNNGFNVYDQFTAHLGNQQHEDCLALNIWTKTPSDAGIYNKPVFVFFHGGRFTIPGTNSPFYNGQYFADTEDVVVVTVNYRLGIFGFSGAPGITQNVGMLDQRAAIEWIHENIAGYGGDPERIIAFGQSAGGSSVDYYAYSWIERPIVAGLISHSGTAFSFIPNSMEYSQSLFYNVSGALGCGSGIEDTVDSLACVRSKDAADVLAAARNVPALPTEALKQATFHPTVDNLTVFADYTPLADNGLFARVPYMAGNADYEAGFYRVSAYGANVTLLPEEWDLYNQRAFTCPTKYAVEARAKADIPTWRYRYMGDWDNLRLYDTWGDYPDSGAYHGAELSMLFGTTYDVTGEANNLPEALVSRYIMGAWAAFGRNPKTGLESYGWYAPHEPTLMRLAYQNQSVPSVVDPNLYDWPCPPVEHNDPLPGRGAF